MKLIKKTAACLCAAVMLLPCAVQAAMPALAAGEIAHDPGRNVKEEGVGNPFNFGERNTPADASIEEIRALNHKWTVQQVKYALYKEIDEHWDMVTVRYGQTDREKVYALFLGVGTRESTLGGNGDGSDLETAFSEGFGVSSAHAYGTLQTAVTAFYDPGTSFMQEEDVPEMEWYPLTKENFYDGVISNHMGLRKITHFVRSAIVDYGLEGYQIVRAALKGHNTGWANYTAENEGYYGDYPDECIALARWYYEQGHLYDNEFTWTNSDVAADYRTMETWTDWWYDKEPSLEPIPEHKESTTAPTETTQPETSKTVSETTESSVTLSETTQSETSAQTETTQSTSVSVSTGTTSGSSSAERQDKDPGDVNCDGRVNVSDAILLARFVAEDKSATITDQGLRNADMNGNGAPDSDDTVMILKQLAGIKN
ncbi:MAG: dockerin [Oscillospiraceae bacterium]|nr:dockerin [Oscillospiraceae bacterium]